MSSNLAHSAARGAFFTLGAQGAKIILQFLSVIVLARLLTPHDYGLIAIVLVVVGIGEIFRDFGLTSASIQAPTLSTGQRDNLFWINAGIGLLLTAVMYFLAVPIEAVTRQPEIVGMVHWLCLLFLLNGLATQHRANLARDLRFRAMAAIDVSAAAIALTAAVVAALLGAEYWALVIQQLTSGVVVVVGSVLAGRWLPRWYSRAHSVRALLGFGWNIVATNLLVYAGSQIDTVLVGLKFGTTPLGLYNRAYQLLMTPLTQVRSPMKNVALPVLSRVQQEPARFDNYVTAAQLMLGYGLGIPLVLVTGLSDPIVRIMLGPRWLEAAPILGLFAVAGLLSTIAFVGYWVYLSRGLGRQLFLYTIVTTLIKAACIVTGSFFGLIGVAIGFTVAPAISWPLSLFWLSRVTPMPTARLYAGAGRILALTASVGVVAWAVASTVSSWGSWPMLLVGLPAGLLTAVAFLILPVYRRDLQNLWTFVRLMLKRQPRTA
ncbi:lipopolysaccharide biosynthesis protein [Microbacterium sp.]|uniref:lipopolysaccharide biosynthesis protein n=1 Tax=Microbacterium sp. TaxID=51671 RepID=UPI000928B42F|nr:lipopolysaccharide biosynthesis protein [Microbacterium sp.]MBN9192462.1 lipopolysaccharide biosynthesis protein [Microbacterium sp.]OJU65529.1 MAG: lipopolysaccharide biosynthesis protein [Microbacterium sp. 70-38]